MATAYAYLSKWYERLNDDCGYEQWSQYFLKGLKALGAGPKGLEVGCGSGYFSRELARHGYRMTGCDLSAPMLSEAMRLSREEGLRIDFFQADAVTLALGTYDFLLAPNDCYNYIPPEKLPAAFRHAFRSLRKGGIFWFDVSSEYKLREKIANNVFADDRNIPFEYGGLEYKFFLPKIRGGVSRLEYNAPIVVTNLERTLTDCIDRIDLAESWQVTIHFKEENWFLRLQNLYETTHPQAES